MLVVPMSKAMPYLCAVVSPGSMAITSRKKVVTVSAAFLAQQAGQAAQDRGRDIAGQPLSVGRAHLVPVRGLVVLVVGRRGLDVAFLDAGIEAHARSELAGGEDLVAGLRLRRRQQDGAVGDDPGLAGQPEALVHLLVAELDLIGDSRRRHVALEDLDAAGPAAPARPAGRRDLESGALRDLEIGLAGGGLRGGAVGRLLRIDDPDRHGFRHRSASLSRTRPPARPHAEERHSRVSKYEVARCRARTILEMLLHAFAPSRRGIVAGRGAIAGPPAVAYIPVTGNSGGRRRWRTTR
jgi:hypothetical protein